MSHKHETENREGEREQRRNAFERGLLWLTAIVAGLLPFPWW
jgi:hypothetical protein